jgi:hypothetical protein
MNRFLCILAFMDFKFRFNAQAAIIKIQNFNHRNCL